MNSAILDVPPLRRKMFDHKFLRDKINLPHDLIHKSFTYMPVFIKINLVVGVLLQYSPTNLLFSFIRFRMFLSLFPKLLIAK